MASLALNVASRKQTETHYRTTQQTGVLFKKTLGPQRHMESLTESIK